MRTRFALAAEDSSTELKLRQFFKTRRGRTYRFIFTIVGGELRNFPLLEAKFPIERWRRHYNTVRPHGSLGYRPSAPETHQPLHFVPAAMCPPFADCSDVRPIESQRDKR